VASVEERGKARDQLVDFSSGGSSERFSGSVREGSATTRVVLARLPSLQAE